MLQGGRINTQTWQWVHERGVLAFSDASGRRGETGWSWGGVLADHTRGMTVHRGACPEWVTEPTTAELWGMVEMARLIAAIDPNAIAALVSDNSYAIFIAVSALRGEVPPACYGEARDASAAVLQALETGEGDLVAAARAHCCVEIMALGCPSLLRCDRAVPEMEIADELARLQGGFPPRRESYVQRWPDLRALVYAT